MIDALRIPASTAADVPAIANIVDQADRHYIARIGTLPLRQGIPWPDGKPFTAKDFQCTWDLLTGKAGEKLRLNPRNALYLNLDKVITGGHYEVTCRLMRPHPSFVALRASGFAPVSPCLGSPRDM